MPVELGSAPLDLPDISQMPLKQAQPLPEEYLEEENEMVGWNLECCIEFN